VYPDFIFCSFDDEPNARLVILESKGAQLEGNHDTEYKARLLDWLTENFSWDTTPSSGEMELVQDDGKTVICKLLVDTYFETEIKNLVYGPPTIGG